MQSYSPDELDDLAHTGTVMDKVMVASRTNVRQDTIAYLMETESDDEVKLAIMARPGATAEQLRWAGTSDSPFVLNRLIAMDQTPLGVVIDIRDRAEQRTGEVWERLLEFANRVITRRKGGGWAF